MAAPNAKREEDLQPWERKHGCKHLEGEDNPHRDNPQIPADAEGMIQVDNVPGRS